MSGAFAGELALITADALESVAPDCRESGGDALAVPTDVTDAIAYVAG